MKRNWSTALVLFTIFLANNRNDRSFVTGAAISNGEELQPPSDLDERDLPEISDADVKQLESLKQSLGKTLAMMKSQSSVYTDINGHKDTHASTQEEVSKDGDVFARINEQMESHQSGTAKPAAKVRLDVDVGDVHKTILDNVPVKERRHQQDNNVDVYSTYSSGIQYSPLDMAEYVFWTGDEKGVTSAIQEFLRDGLMNHDEAIGFLEEIKFNLEYLQAHYSQQGGIHSPSHRDRLEQSKERAFNLQKNFGIQEDQPVPTKHDDLQKEMEKKNSESTSRPTKQLKTITASRSPDDTISDEEYEILLERLRVADFLYTQYSLEEVIYQLAKVMFSQSLTRGSAEAQEALQKFTTFLESETEQGHISRTLEKKVLDVLIAALTDTLTEHPELVAAAREGLGGGSTPHLPPGNNMLQQILEMTPEEKEAAKTSLYAAFKEGHHYQTHLAPAKRTTDSDRSKSNKN